MTAKLAALLPEREARLDSSEILERFIGFATEGGLSLYPAQEEAILELLEGKHVILNTPTGSGKSLVAAALHFQAMARGETSYYTAPIKALANEKFFWLCDTFGPENVGLLTGDASINPGAPIICCTAEILSNLCLREESPDVDWVVMDEFHYYGDRDRGMAWQIPLLTLSHGTFLLMSATLGDTQRIEEGLKEVTGKEVAVVRSFERPVPLEFEYALTPLHETIQKLVHDGRDPIYLVSFSQRAAAERAQDLMSVNFATKEEKEAIKEALSGVRFDTPYGKDLSRFLRHGVGLHHAGLLPRYRLLVEKLAQEGLLRVVSGTDTLGVGVNIPIRTVLFTQLCKFDGEKVGVLSVRDFQQIAGRAGRKGFDDRGWVVAQAPEHVIENLRIAEKQAQTKKKLPKKQPPTKGYAHWDEKTFERLQSQQPEPLTSRFDVDHGVLLPLLQSPSDRRGGGYARLCELVARSHTTPYEKRRQLRQAARYFRHLRQAGIVDVVRREGRPGAHVRVNLDLQKEFSLNHTLSLYLLEALDFLERETATYALDVLTLVESILENPYPVLYKQLDKLKGERLAELKAQGMDYEDRLEELEKVEWPKPNRDFVYSTFNDFAARHPWVGDENIRPKSIAREMYESSHTFTEYVRLLGLQRSEGVLLRYLSDVYKTLVQNVPESYRTEEVDEIALFLREMLRDVDSSLLEEWERLQGLEPRASQGAAEEKPYDLAEDARGLRIRLRVELHRLLHALALRDWERALAALRPGHDWTAEALEEALSPYFEEFGAIDTTPAARQAHHTRMKEVEPRRWEVEQRLVAPLDPDAWEEDEEQGATDWALFCEIDLRDDFDETEPLLILRRIGT